MNFPYMQSLQHFTTSPRTYDLNKKGFYISWLVAIFSFFSLSLYA